MIQYKQNEFFGPGGDAINNFLLKNLSRQALVYLTYLFNGCVIV
jgi:hypothetical protein